MRERAPSAAAGGSLSPDPTSVVELDERLHFEQLIAELSRSFISISAAEVLEKEGIHCNLTLLFGLHQAIACAEAKVTLISPFVGRILDWYKKATGRDSYPANEDPGVVSVTRPRGHPRAAPLLPELPELPGEPGYRGRQIGHRTPQLTQHHVVISAHPRPKLDGLVTVDAEEVFELRTDLPA